MNAQGECFLRRLNDAYNAIISTLLTFDVNHNLKLNNFTNLGGNVFFKVVRVTGTTPSSQGGVLNIPIVINGATIDSAKVNGILPVIEFDSNGRMPPNISLTPGYQYEAFVDNNFVSFQLHSTNSSGLLNKPCSCLVFYTN
jgi:hypothetical protein